MPYSFKAKEEIKAYRFVKFNDESELITASDGGDNLTGISSSLDTAAEDAADVYVIGERAEIEAGENFKAGDALTSNSEGCAVKAAAENNIGAIALENAAKGDIALVLIAIQRNIQ